MRWLDNDQIDHYGMESLGHGTYATNEFPSMGYQTNDYYTPHDIFRVEVDMVMAQFRFQDLDIWQKAIEIGDHLFDLANKLEKQSKYRFAEQLRDASLSMSNNIAEGAGSDTDPEFRRYLDIARKSVYENVNMLIVFGRRDLLASETVEKRINDLHDLSRQIFSFRDTLGE